MRAEATGVRGTGRPLCRLTHIEDHFRLLDFVFLDTTAGVTSVGTHKYHVRRRHSTPLICGRHEPDGRVIRNVSGSYRFFIEGR